jgi:hypothetical protein
VWTGSEVLVLGGADLAAGLADGAAYDPAADTWRPVPAAPRAPGPPVGGALGDASLRVAWTGDRAVVVPPATPFAATGAGLLTYAPATGTWSELPPFGSVVQVLAVGNAGADLSAVVLDYQTGNGLLHRLAPDGAAWTGDPDGPPLGRDQPPAVEGGGRLWLAWAGENREAVAVYDLAEGTWALTPDRPDPLGGEGGGGPLVQLEARDVAWTGDELVLLAGRSPGLLRVHRWRPVLSPDERAGLVPEGTALGLRRWFYETTGGTAPAP